MFFTSLLAFFSLLRAYTSSLRRVDAYAMCAFLPPPPPPPAAAVVAGPSSLRCQSRSIPGGARFAAALSLDIRRRIFRGWRQGYGVVGRHNPRSGLAAVARFPRLGANFIA
jgi:hypothetical protein